MPTITFRADSEVVAALAELMSDGSDRSRAIREAILTARRLRKHARLLAEAEGLATDDADVTEARNVLADMETLRAW